MSSDTPAASEQPHAKAPHTPAATPAHGADPGAKLTRAGALWTSLILGFLVLILLLVFVTQNIESADFQFLGWKWSLPKGVAMLLAAIGGGLITVTVGTARILQLRRVAKKSHAVAIQARSLAEQLGELGQTSGD
ncbi:DUF1049 domain-containing protein [Mycobacterium sp.]|uniref:LapA family protein n=1 Tax=Mycobacterium sp. TaxID=1785 RepID=UPI002C66010E|nr:DUF1049 domain-containing protein [Mycobacterium sp.]HTQ20578.1 DUF1049 domain-containing protein [Mycobacterium sp.]